ncbi:MAG: 16S rRNA (guanine(966)-N(2))-methyltransferase RsmD [Pseudomonadales bacterium]
MVNKTQRGTSRRNSLRIIAGTLRGSRLAFVDADGLRPTPERAREMLFNWLQNKISGAHCLDLFAGSGALALEALSRGAASACAVESSAAAAATIEREAARLGVAGLTVCRQDALGWLAAHHQPAPMQRFDIAFLDPPFGKDLLAGGSKALEAAGVLADGAAIYVESAVTTPVPDLPVRWQLHRERRVGDVRCALYVRD